MHGRPKPRTVFRSPGNRTVVFFSQVPTKQAAWFLIAQYFMYHQFWHGIGARKSKGREKAWEETDQGAENGEYYIHAAHAKQCLPRAVNRLLGKYICSSQERVRYFPSQEGATRIFPRKGVFAWPEKEQKQKPHDWLHTVEERTFPRKGRNERSLINFYNIYLFYSILRYFMFPRRIAPSEQIFQRTAVVDCFWFTRLYMPVHCMGGAKKQEAQNICFINFFVC